FLVDSVEGHRRFRKPKIFEIVYNDLINRAKSRGSDLIIFNQNVGNKTPQEFLAYLKQIGLKEEEIRMKFNTDCYLEANKWKVKGYVVRFNSK
ncbi:MAG: hypothetical protein QXL86_02500, partial [Candidatus Aenigmatarchaeota archaeon]